MSDAEEPRQPITPQYILTNMLLKQSSIRNLVIVTETDEGMLHAYWSDMKDVMAIGMFEVGKMSVFDEINKSRVDVTGEETDEST